jgi:hypothetical protein
MCTFAEYGEWISAYSLITMNKKGNIYQINDFGKFERKINKTSGGNLEPRRVHLAKPVETLNSPASV